MITSLRELSAEEAASVRLSIEAGDYNLLLGAGASLDSQDAQGSKLLSGEELRVRLCTVTGVRASSSLPRAYAALNLEQIESEVTQRYLGCKPGLSIASIPSFAWNRVYTLNVDDALEAAYKAPARFQTARPVHYRDAFSDIRTPDEVQIVHLHGFSREGAKGYVFSRSQYATNMAEANAWMTVLADAMVVDPFIIAGTQLDEVDIDFYLARRSSSTVREDRGLSFLIEPFPDQGTTGECHRHGLTLYQGTLDKFVQELNGLCAGRATPGQIAELTTRELFNGKLAPSAAAAFAADFDFVPNHCPPAKESYRFYLGNSPTWEELCANADVGRALTTRLRGAIQACVEGKLPERLVICLDDVGSGKTTVLRRVAYDLASTNIKVIACSALSRLEPRSTSEALNAIEGPLVVIIDNVSEQAQSIAAILPSVTKRDIVFGCSDRIYRQRYIASSLGNIPVRSIDGLRLSHIEAEQLVAKLSAAGIVGDQQAARNPGQRIKQLVREPIAVATCHVLNNFRPLDRIVQSTLYEAAEEDTRRYVAAAVAEFCYRGGIRLEVLAAVSGKDGWKEQFGRQHPLPLSYSDRKTKNFVVPANTTLSQRTLENVDRAHLVWAFNRLAVATGARVSREAIRIRTPEARLAGRLFDYDEVVAKFLDIFQAADFYEEAQSAWRWNSRFWEQYALYYLSR